jgi:uncharacterized protein YbjT (DUF2867 family)
VAGENSDRLILVTGATGKQGGAALRHLRARGFAVRALTRNPEKPEARALAGERVEVVGGDLNDADSVRRAMEGVWGAYSVQESRSGAEVKQGELLADAAQRARINQFVYSSVAAADQNTGIPHFETKHEIEKHIRQLGIPYTIIRPVFFMENWLGMKDMLRGGMLVQPLSPERRLQMIAVDDIGAFVALAFEHPDHWRNRAFNLAGDELSMNEAAAQFGRKLGREVQYQQVPWDEFEKRAGREYTMMYRWFEDHGYTCDIAAARSEYRDLHTFERWLHETRI